MEREGKREVKEEGGEREQCKQQQKGNTILGPSIFIDYTSIGA